MKLSSLHLPVTFLREGRSVVAYTPALDLSTCGRDMQQAMRRFDEAVALFFDELEAMGTTEKVLRELGWQRIRRQWQPPVVISTQIKTVPLQYA